MKNIQEGEDCRCVWDDIRYKSYFLSKSLNINSIFVYVKFLFKYNMNHVFLFPGRNLRVDCMVQIE